MQASSTSVVAVEGTAVFVRSEAASDAVVPRWLEEEEQALGLDQRPASPACTYSNHDYDHDHDHGQDRDEVSVERDRPTVPLAVLEVLSPEEVRGWLSSALCLAELTLSLGGERLPLLVEVHDRPDVQATFPGAVGAVGFAVLLGSFGFSIDDLPRLRVAVGTEVLVPLHVTGLAANVLPSAVFSTWDVLDVLRAARGVRAMPSAAPVDSGLTTLPIGQGPRERHVPALGCAGGDPSAGSAVAGHMRSGALLGLLRTAASICLPADGGEVIPGRPWAALSTADPALRARLATELLERDVRVGRKSDFALDVSEHVLRALGCVDDEYVHFQHPDRDVPLRLLPATVSPSAPLLANHHAEIAKEAALPGQGVLHPVALVALSPRAWWSPMHPALADVAPPRGAGVRWGDLPPFTGLITWIAGEQITVEDRRLAQWFTEEELQALVRIHDADLQKRRARQHLLSPIRRVLAHHCPDGPPLADDKCPHGFTDIRFAPSTDHREQMAAVAARIASAQDQVAPCPPIDQVLVTIILPTRDRLDDLRHALQSVLLQSHENLEVVVVDDGSTDGTLEYLDALEDPRVRWTRSPGRGAGAARNAGAALARGQILMWMDSDDLFLPGAVAAVAAACSPEGWCYTGAALWDGSHLLAIGEPFDETRLRFDNYITQQALGISRSAFLRTGGYDEALVRSIDYDLVLRLLDVATPTYVPVIGSVLNTMRHLPRITTAGSAQWAPHVRNRALPAWAGAAATAVDAPRASVIIPVLLSWKRAASLLKQLRQQNPNPAELEIVVVDDGLNPQGYGALTAIAAAYESIVVTTVENQGFAAACNAGALASRGRVLVFLNDDATPSPGAIETLVTHYEREHPAAVQGISVTGDDLFEGLGIVGGPDGLPYALAAGLPVDVNLVDDIRRLSPQALNAAFLAVGRDDFVALQGFDPLFRNGMEDIDLSLRLAARTQRRLHVEPDATIRHNGFGSGQQRKKHIPENRGSLSRRWRGRLRRDDVDAWRLLGFEVKGYQVASRDPITLVMPSPLVEPKGQQSARPWQPSRFPSVTNRLAIVIGTPHRQLLTETWGDTHLALGLRRKLMQRGLECRIVSYDDPRPAFEGHHMRLDLLGLHEPKLRPEARQAAWVISHPSRLLQADLSPYEHVFIASPTWHPPALHAGNSSYLPQPTDLLPGDHVDEAARARAADQAIFVGSSRQTVRPCIEYALEARIPLQVYGTGWEVLARKRGVVLSGPVSRSTALGLYAGARLVLNDHWPDMLLNGFLSNRVADVLAVGGRVATDIPDGLDARLAGVLPLRNPDELLAAWHAPADAGRPELPFQYYLEHTAERIISTIKGLGGAR